MHACRLATIADSDRILVVQDGRIVEVKTPSKYVHQATRNIMISRTSNGSNSTTGNKSNSKAITATTSNGVRQGAVNGLTSNTSKQNGSNKAVSYS